MVSTEMDWTAFEMAYEEFDFEKQPFLNTKVSRRKLAAVLRRAHELRQEIVAGHADRQRVIYHG